MCTNPTIGFILWKNSFTPNKWMKNCTPWCFFRLAQGIGGQTGTKNWSVPEKTTLALEKNVESEKFRVLEMEDEVNKLTVEMFETYGVCIYGLMCRFCRWDWLATLPNEHRQEYWIKPALLCVAAIPHLCPSSHHHPCDCFLTTLYGNLPI